MERHFNGLDECLSIKLNLHLIGLPVLGQTGGTKYTATLNIFLVVTICYILCFFAYASWENIFGNLFAYYCVLCQLA